MEETVERKRRRSVLWTCLTSSTLKSNAVSRVKKIPRVRILRKTWGLPTSFHSWKKRRRRSVRSEKFSIILLFPSHHFPFISFPRRKRNFLHQHGKSTETYWLFSRFTKSSITGITFVSSYICIYIRIYPVISHLKQISHHNLFIPFF